MAPSCEAVAILRAWLHYLRGQPSSVLGWLPVSIASKVRVRRPQDPRLACRFIEPLDGASRPLTFYVRLYMLSTKERTSLGPMHNIEPSEYNKRHELDVAWLRIDLELTRLRRIAFELTMV